MLVIMMEIELYDDNFLIKLLPIYYDVKIIKTKKINK